MRNERVYHYNVNGFDLRIVYEKETVEEILEPLLTYWKKLREEKGRRIFVFMSAPPGCGKSTLTRFLELRSCEDAEKFEKVTALGLDGFHYHQDYLESHLTVRDGQTISLKSIKGAPETYDFGKLNEKLTELSDADGKWPLYSRKLHDVIEDACDVTGDIILIEGNWLLLNEDPWRDMIKRCDDSVFISAPEALLKDKLIDRKMKGGSSQKEAADFYEQSDGRNVRRLLDNHLKARLNLYMPEYGVYTQEQEMKSDL